MKISCPHCQQVGSVRDDLPSTKRIKCPHCGQRFHLDDDDLQSTMPLKPTPDDDIGTLTLKPVPNDDTPPEPTPVGPTPYTDYYVPSTDHLLNQVCPNCRGTIPAGNHVCEFCGYALFLVEPIRRYHPRIHIPRNMPPPPRFPWHSLGCAVLSVIPGLGHLYNKRPRWALFWFVFVLYQYGNASPAAYLLAHVVCILHVALDL